MSGRVKNILLPHSCSVLRYTCIRFINQLCSYRAGATLGDSNLIFIVLTRVIYEVARNYRIVYLIYSTESTRGILTVSSTEKAASKHGGVCGETWLREGERRLSELQGGRQVQNSLQSRQKLVGGLLCRDRRLWLHPQRIPRGMHTLNGRLVDWSYAVVPLSAVLVESMSLCCGC